MNKLFKVFALVAMMVFGSQAMAQSNSGSLLLGASFPIGNYGEFESLNDFALTTAESTYAGASIGFNLGLKWYFNIGVKGLGVMLSADGFYNGKNEQLKTTYRDQESEFNGQILDGSFTYKAKPNYFNVPVMLGLNYIYHFNPNFGFYIQAGAGGNASFITSMETYSDTKLTILGLETETKTTTTQKYDAAFSFAYQAGLGFEVGKNFVIGCSFYDLGAAKVKGDMKVKTVVNSGTPDTSSDFKEYGTVHPMMILARIGFKF